MTGKSAGQPVAQPATAELLALAAKTREDINIRDLEGAIAGALTEGVPWAVVMNQTVRMLAQNDGDVRGLRTVFAELVRLHHGNRRTERTNF
ncbi:hypothetical protein [Actinomadura litoris]|uniref:Uncharacterized protein n=1 Tax=Actinomadura litoris TaxID=2678616 RepID=A0A7K1LAW5_9ACTN|nr:hypothetical protein [Actinomadura litoris]MUN41463.1 hypothetical protein [Actinomadura litoris]